MRARWLALGGTTLMIGLSGCYGGLDESSDELAATGTEASDETATSSTDASTSESSTDAGTDTTATTDTTTDATTTATTDASTTTDTTTTDTATTDTTDTGGPEGCTADALELVDLVNAYRAENGLPAIPASPSLCTVATTHVHDLADNGPHLQPGGCNLHSWSDQGSWSPCCYTPDHAQAQCMWDKPSELSVYPGYGYENAASGVSSPAQGLAAWKSSPPHNEVILNLGIWANHPWQALGADVHQGFSVLWFGEQVDPG